ncbi:MAG: inner membrane CreD family protein [Armatimonadota bacterium]
MTGSRIASVILIFLGASLAWVCLGQAMQFRSTRTYKTLEPKVAGLWGAPQKQRAPLLSVEETVPAEGEGETGTETVTHELEPDSSDIKVGLSLDLRRKGLLWYRTYEVDFDATYTVAHAYTASPVLVAKVFLPSPEATYDDFLFSVNDQEATPGGDLSQGVVLRAPVTPGQPATIRLHYRSRGMDTWSYSFGSRVSQVKNFTLTATTDFDGFDFPTLSPTDKRDLGGGWELVWAFESLISPFEPAIEMPGKLNPGPLASRISLFAPVGLLFFLAVMVIIGVVRDRNLHPMHYFFISAAFFAFHLLFSYLVDHVTTNVAFLVAAVTSVLLVSTYVLRVAGAGFTFGIAAPPQ